MPAASPPRAILFDLIGVLAEPSWRELVAEPRALPWGALKTGAAAEAEFWPVAAAATYRRALGLRADRLALVDRLRDRGLEVFVASNFARAWAHELRARPEAARFAGWFVSGELGVAKPDPRFFALVRAQVPAGALFVDDKADNCDAAAAAGLRAIWAWPGRDLEAAIEAALAADSPAS